MGSNPLITVMGEVPEEGESEGFWAVPALGCATLGSGFPKWVRG